MIQRSICSTGCEVLVSNTAVLGLSLYKETLDSLNEEMVLFHLSPEKICSPDVPARRVKLMLCGGKKEI
jgi:hypothetical protein